MSLASLFAKILKYKILVSSKSQKRLERLSTVEGKHPIKRPRIAV